MSRRLTHIAWLWLLLGAPALAQDASVVTVAPAASAPEAAAPVPEPDRSAPPKLIASSCARPEYPLASVRAKESGTTVARVAVSELGEVTQVTVDTSSGHPRLDGAARYALSLCKFQPARNADGMTVARATLIRQVWKLDDALPDPWVRLRDATRDARWTPTADLAAVAFASPSGSSAEQRLKILRRLVDTARENAGCASIERVAASPMPPEWKVPEVVKSASGGSVRIVGEQWAVTQCDVAMTYGLIMRFPDDAPAHFVMTPFGPDVLPSKAAVPTPAYATRVALAVQRNIVFAAGALNPRAELELRLERDGRIIGTRLTRPSGDARWDRAVLDAVARTARLPVDADGTAPPVVVLSMRPR